MELFSAHKPENSEREEKIYSLKKFEFFKRSSKNAKYFCPFETKYYFEILCKTSEN